MSRIELCNEFYDFSHQFQTLRFSVMLRVFTRLTNFTFFAIFRFRQTIVGYEAQQSPLFYVFVTVFSLDGAQTTIGFKFCMSNEPIKMSLKLFSHSVRS